MWISWRAACSSWTTRRNSITRMECRKRPPPWEFGSAWRFASNHRAPECRPAAYAPPQESMTNDFNSAILDEVAHRPWPRPAAPWLMTQTWHDLLFTHWPVDPVLLRAKVPESFDVDLFEDRAWIGVIPFHMTNVSPRGVPSLPWLSEFPELNVRTYVRVGDRAGVYFFSLDAGSALAVTAARTLLNLPYHRAEMTVERSGSGIIYHSARSDGSNGHFDATYEPNGTPFQPS